MAEIVSPYKDHDPKDWGTVTAKLIEEHPLPTKEIVEVVLMSWNDLHATKVGGRKLQIGKEIFPKPQIVGFFLHQLISVELEERDPDKWRGEKEKSDKDLVFIPDSRYSIEIKTSSHARSIFGNRSYAQKSASGKSSRKSKSGYFLTVNFSIFKKAEIAGKITKIRFGWLDHSDWIGQDAPTGQQSRLRPEADEYKLVHLYP